MKDAPNVSTKKEQSTMLTARVPASLVKRLDKSADRARRSRSAEVVLRLQNSLKADRQKSDV
jgi:predicted transcriptional regulator